MTHSACVQYKRSFRITTSDQELLLATAINVQKTPVASLRRVGITGLGALLDPAPAPSRTGNRSWCWIFLCWIFSFVIQKKRKKNLSFAWCSPRTSKLGLHYPRRIVLEQASSIGIASTVRTKIFRVLTMGGGPVVPASPRRRRLLIWRLVCFPFPIPFRVSPATWYPCRTHRNLLWHLLCSVPTWPRSLCMEMEGQSYFPRPTLIVRIRV